MSEPAARRRVRVVCAVVRDGELVLMTQRPPGGPLGLMWEFPGGKLEPGEAPGEALVREVHEELGVRSEAHETLAVHEYDYAHGVHVELHFIRCTLASREFVPNAAVHAWRWLPPRDVRLHEVLEGDRDFLRGLGAPDR
ncbi:MAG: NUDIX domain-containing protein [Candidatus Eisenbacteria bacterium]